MIETDKTTYLTKIALPQHYEPSHLDWRNFPEETEKGVKFCYYDKPIGELVNHIEEKRQDTSQKEDLRQIFRRLVHPDYDIVAEIDNAYPTSKFEGPSLILTTQLAPPNLHVITVDSSIRAMQQLGFPIEFGGIGTYLSDTFVQDDDRGDGIKQAYATPVIAEAQGDTVRLSTTEIFDAGRYAGTALKYIPAENLGPFAQLMDMATERGFLEQGQMLTLDNFYTALSRMAGIEAPIKDKSPLDSRQLAYLLTTDLSQFTADVRQKKVLIPVLSGPEDSRQNICLKDINPELKAQVMSLMEQGLVEQASQLVEGWRFSAGYYYGKVPSRPAAVSYGNRVLVEAYEDGPDFTKMVTEGYKALQRGVTYAEGAGKERKSTTMPGVKWGPTVIQEAWLSGFNRESMGLKPMMNAHSTSRATDMTSLAIPTFVFDPTLRAQHIDYLTAQLNGMYGKEGLAQMQFADIHAASLMLTLDFMKQT